jgi:hypothetical protein
MPVLLPASQRDALVARCTVVSCCPGASETHSPAMVCVQIQISTVTAAGVEVGEPYEVSTYWGYKAFQHTEYHGQKKKDEVFVGR